VQGGSNSYYIHPSSVAPRRKFLFGLPGSTSQEEALAKSCPIAIDDLRDEHGIAPNDTQPSGGLQHREPHPANRIIAFSDRVPPRREK
jgi:hypothetical protein